MNWAEQKRQAEAALRAREIGALDTGFGRGKTTKALIELLRQATEMERRVTTALRHSGSRPYDQAA